MILCQKMRSVRSSSRIAHAKLVRLLPLDSCSDCSVRLAITLILNCADGKFLGNAVALEPLLCHSGDAGEDAAARNSAALAADAADGTDGGANPADHSTAGDSPGGGKQLVHGYDAVPLARWLRRYAPD